VDWHSSNVDVVIVTWEVATFTNIAEPHWRATGGRVKAQPSTSMQSSVSNTFRSAGEHETFVQPSQRAQARSNSINRSGDDIRSVASM
jgi:hypothetical protein